MSHGILSKLRIEARVIPINAGRKKFTSVGIHANGALVYTAILGGHYVPSQALKEFCKSPERFRAVKGAAPAQVYALSIPEPIMS